MKTTTYLKGLLLSAISLTAIGEVKAQEVVYDLRAYENFDWKRQFAIGKDDDGYAVWQWARYTGSDYDFSGPELYNSNLYPYDGYYDHVYYTPDLNLQPGKYIVYTSPRKKNNQTAKDSRLTVLLGKGDMNESAYDSGKLQTLAEYQGFPYVNITSAASIDNVAAYECEFEITEAGAYKIGFYGSGAGFTLHQTYIAKYDGGSTEEPKPEPEPEPTPDPIVPSAVTDFTALVTGPYEVTVGFSLPVESTAGESLASKDLKYTIYRDGASVSTKSRQVAGTYITFKDVDVAVGEHIYAVDVTVEDMTSERSEATVKVSAPAPDPVASIDLPFADSFAGASFGDLWQVDEVSGNVQWVASGDLTSQLPLMKVYDNDGGMAVFKAWDGTNGDYARLATVPITKSSSTAPVLDFMFGHSGARATTDKIKIQVSADGGAWQDVKDAVIATYIPELENGGWTYYKYSLDQYIQNCTTYRVGFLGICENLNANIPIDDVKIYNVADKDVSIKSFEVSDEVIAGNEIEISIGIENSGAATLKASDYTVVIESDFPVDFDIERVDIPSLGTAFLTAKAPVTAEEVLNGHEYSISASVHVPGNASAESLTTEVRKTTAKFVGYKVPANLVAAGSGSVISSLSWESVKDLDHVNINISENFNDLRAREQVEQTTPDGKTEKVWIDGVKGNFNGFVSVDMDKQDGGSYYSSSGSEFQVFKDFMTGSMPQGHSGQYIALTLPGNIQQDDWLITPALNAAESSVINFGARIAYIYREGDAYNNSLEVLYATEDYKLNNPAASFTKSLYSNTSKATSGDLPHDGNYHWLRVNGIPAEAKYVAIHFITKSAMQTGVWIDRLTVAESDTQPLVGYYVYRRNEGRLNAEPLDITQLTYNLADVTDAPASYYVTALYADGESAPSNFIGEVSAVENVSIYDFGTDCRIYNLQGICVDDKNLVPGIYIRRNSDGTSSKFIIR